MKNKTLSFFLIFLLFISQMYSIGFAQDSDSTIIGFSETNYLIPSINSDITAEDFIVSGYIEPDFSSGSSSDLSGIKVTLSGDMLSDNPMTVTTDKKGYYEFKNVPATATKSGYTLTISGRSLLEKRILFVIVRKNIPQPPVDLLIDEIWSGDCDNNGVINIVDIMEIANAFNTDTNSANYSTASDLNLDGSVNINDIMIAAKNFNKSSEDYTKTTIYSYNKLSI